MPTPARTGPIRVARFSGTLHERVRRNDRILAHEVRDRRVAARTEERCREPGHSGQGADRCRRVDEGQDAEGCGTTEVGEDHHPLARPAVDQGTDGDAEDDAGQQLADEQDADPPGRVRLVVERDPDREERGPRSQGGDEPGEQQTAVRAVLGHPGDGELRGELAQHPGRAYNVGHTASAVRNGTCSYRRVARMARSRWTHEQLVAGVRAGDHRALARSISMVENREPGALGSRAGALSRDRLDVLRGYHGPARRRQVLARSQR